MMDIKHNKHDRGGEFVIEENGNRHAELAYTNAGEGKVLFDHTFVEQQFRREGIGRDLVEAGVNFARENNLKVVPLCPFVKKTIDETPEFQNVLAD